MRKIENIKELHSLLLNMGKEFHKICVENDIPYYMLGGTMLGAVRHKGFIPWDDDMDFGIPREHYKRFAEVATKQLPDRYKFLTYDNSEYACLGIGKLVDTLTFTPELFSIKTTEKVGIFLDVFPLDYTNGRTDIISTNTFSRMLFKFQKILYINADDRPLINRTIAKIIQSVCPLGRSTIPSYVNRLMLKRRIKPTHVGNLFGAWAMKELVPIDYFGKPQLYRFEDTCLYGVQDSDGYLRHLYGRYLELPPVEKRHVHMKECYYLG